ncbi:MAG: coproporphyrinogen III oxidase [Candidatus Methanolliviera sp. GoM_asphalt]|nr:MAG: coproporphyrinogen III oxidase [Candidatus Methanolliviera sp. GoM_asphalt]
MMGKLVQTALMGVIEANRAICRIPITKNIMEGAMKGGEVVIPFDPQIPVNSDGAMVYINIPFCKGRCAYCPFYSFPYAEERVKPYVEAVKKEISLYKAKLGDTKIGDVYFGGGTPSLLYEGVIEIIDHLRSNFKIAGEIGVEVHPRDVNEEICDALSNAGISKVSMGVESFDDEELKIMNRRGYDGDSAIKAIELLMDKGFYTGIDLMVGCPGQTVSSVLSDLETAVKTEVHQIYPSPLALSPDTLWASQLKKGKVEFPPAREVIKMWRAILDFLPSNGYEMSMACFKHKRAAVEKKKDYFTMGHAFIIGMGVRAFGYTPPTLTGYCNTLSFEEYVKAVNEGRFPVAMGASILNQRQLDKIYHSIGLLLGIGERDVERRLNVLMDTGLYGDLRIDKEEFKKRSGVGVDRVLGNLSFLIPFFLFPLKALGIIEEDSREIKINEDLINGITTEILS